MELLIWAAYVPIILAPLLLLIIFSGHHRRRRSLKLPPGPKPWPVIGNLALISALPHRSLAKLSKQYGPLMSVRLGSRRAVVGSSVATARLFLKTHDLLFLDRPKTAAGELVSFNSTDIVWSPYGPYWRLLRKLCSTELFNAKQLASYEHIRVEEIRGLMHDLFELSGRSICLKTHLATANLSIISRMVLGRKYSEELGGEAAVVPPEEFKWMVHEWFVLNGVFNVGDFIPWLQLFDLQGYCERMRRLSGKFDRFLEHVVGEHDERRRHAGEGFVARNMLDVLLQLAEEPRAKVELKRDGIKGFVQNLLAGGTETAGEVVEWAMSELLKHPEAIRKATGELDRAVGRGRWVEESDMPHLPYLYAIIKETMRLHPATPLLSPRVARGDAAIAGYDIPAGTRVMVNVWAIGRDPAIWDSPEEFRPERFVGSPIDVKGQHFEFLPFGSGRRMCPGYTLGLKVIQLSLANLLHGFAWKLPEGIGEEDLSMDEKFGLSVTRKTPLEVLVEPRLPTHMYAR